MRTRQRDRDVEGPRSPWDEVVPGLWMGGHVWTDPAGELRAAVVNEEFDLVVSLFARAGHGPAPHVDHLVAEMPDGPLSAEQLRAVQHLAAATHEALRAHRTVLVRCHSGYNRSGLVVAQTLFLAGLAPAAAIELIRRRRSPWALHNATFVDYLTTGLDVAVLLTDLEPP
ncbi:protein-tyrosine phosphatase family protein [Streptacidiphilus jiangxiensis]|uniref:Dual specificity phosphatase, catalytic domain n=1 Tax=Streptacidiphilus jiangxiensis TaxID=235985 RepID=A0A1H7T9K6_STRJI|nr:dual specificity protein phosphatase family protein [Streptacidiphilus jiangxiensis]SEL80517.1 Dual specificity phosphatase, catalytic domain [Streptacidiphilus jiangxiensis]